ncbi:DNA methyltransferase [Staphylococcus simulans]|uniref:DNA methyltransferase n=1 Tax=Staphylococcus simulans TaxID=1286 RepID=UPI00131A348A|nr:DNA methyltransferase [Staphylococcus simulans]
MLSEKQQFLKQALLESKGSTVDVNLLNTIVLDMSRVADKEITNIINKYKKAKNIIISSPEKELLRKSILGYDVDISNYPGFSEYVNSFNQNEFLYNAYNLILEGINKNKKAVISSLSSRTKIDSDIENKYKEFIDKKEEKYYQLLYYNLKNDSDASKVFTSINKLYDSLENYHYCLIEFNDECTWEKIYKIAIYLENFKIEKGLKAFKKINQIEIMKSFILNELQTKNIESIFQKVEGYYEGVNYGFQFQDLILTEDGKRKLLVFQKVELDESEVPCPSCFEKILRGNSYPKMLYRSFECQNPNCPSRSKSGRGKRFDYYSVKRNNKLLLNDSSNYIDDQLRKEFRRDIVNNSCDFLQFGVKFYTWTDNKILIIGQKTLPDDSYKRNIKKTSLKNTPSNSDLFYELSIFKLLQSVCLNSFTSIAKVLDTKVTIDKATIINGNSTTLLNNHNYKNTFNLAITSPPYFNAREYSQWNNLILYLFDMMLNAKSVYNSLQYGGIYAYNIGDIVDRDNIYVNSQMSIKRQMLGFYSMLIFEIIGYKLIGNDIWDKGEVQSKRNSSSNSFPGFLKPINCYEHIIYFQKGDIQRTLIPTKVTKVDTVKKINSKGENRYGHTAPYPERLVSFIINRLINKIDSPCKLLDPFLGSGTTCIVANRLKYSSTGFELNDKYFALCENRLLNNYENLSFDL